MAENTELSALQLNIDRVLTNYSQGITPAPGVRDALFPSLRVDTQKVDLPQWGYEAFEIIDDEINGRALPKKIDVSLGKTPLTVAAHALAADWDPTELISAMRAAFPWDLGQRKQYVLNAAMDLREEYLAATLAQNPSLYGSNTDSAATLGGKFDDDTSDPLTMLRKIVTLTLPDSCGNRPNVLEVPSDAFAALSSHPRVVQQVFGGVSPQGFATEEQIAAKIGVAKLVVGVSLGRDSAGAVSSRLWTKDCVLAYVDQGPSQESLSYGRSVDWNVMGEATPGSVGSGNRVVSKWFENGPGPLGVWNVKQARFYTKAILAAQAGYLITDCIS